MNAPPNHKYAYEDFKFQLLCQLEIFPENTFEAKSPTKLVATASKYGLIFVGCPKGIQCIQTNSIISLQNERCNNRGKINNFPKRELILNSPPSHIDVSSDVESLAVTNIQQECPVLTVYSIPSFGTATITKKCELRLGSTPGVIVVDLQWNPGVANMIGAVMSDGSAVVCEITPNGPTINSIPPNSQSSCLSWSPKGKRVLIGSKNGSLSQYMPELKIVKAFPQPPIQGKTMGVVSLRWLTNTQYIAAYKDMNNPSASPVVLIINTQGQATNFVNYDDLCCGTLQERPEHFFIHQPQWNIIIIGNGNALETAVLRLEGDSWVQWVFEDGNRADLPLTTDHSEVYNIGMALDLSSQHPVPIGENKAIDPVPVLLMLSHAGTLCFFHSINNTPNAPKLNVAPQHLPPQFFPFSPSNAPEPAVVPPEPASVPQLPQQDKNQFPMPSFDFKMQPATTPATQPSLLSQLSQQSPQQPTAPPQLLPSSVAQSQLSFPQSLASAVPFTFSIPSTQTSNVLGQIQLSTSMPSATQTPPGQTTAQGKMSLPSFGGFAQTPVSLQSQAEAQTTKTNLFSQPSTQTSVAEKSTFGSAKLGLGGSLGAPKIGSMAVPSVTQVSAESSTASSVASAQPAGPPASESKGSEKKTEVGGGDFEARANKEKAYLESIKKVDKELADCLSKCANIEISIIDDSLFEKISEKVGELEIFEKDLRETTTTEAAEVTSLRCTMVEVFGWIENIKSRVRQVKSQRFKECFESQTLNPIIKRYLKNIENHKHFLQTQLQQAKAKLDSNWAAHNDPKNKDSLNIPNLEALYEAIVKQKCILASLVSSVNEIENKLRSYLIKNKKKIPQVIKQSTPSWDSKNKTNWSSKSSSADLDVLADKLLTTKISKEETPSSSFTETSSRYIVLANSKKNLEPAKENCLKQWHKRHKVVRTKAVKLSWTDGLNQSPDIESSNQTPAKSVGNTPLSKPAASRSLFTLQDTKSSVTSKADLPPDSSLTSPSGTGISYAIAYLDDNDPLKEYVSQILGAKSTNETTVSSNAVQGIADNKLNQPVYKPTTIPANNTKPGIIWPSYEVVKPTGANVGQLATERGSVVSTTKPLFSQFNFTLSSGNVNKLESTTSATTSTTSALSTGISTSKSGFPVLGFSNLPSSTGGSTIFGTSTAPGTIPSLGPSVSIFRTAQATSVPTTQTFSSSSTNVANVKTGLVGSSTLSAASSNVISSSSSVEPKASAVVGSSTISSGTISSTNSGSQISIAALGKTDLTSSFANLLNTSTPQTTAPAPVTSSVLVTAPATTSSSSKTTFPVSTTSQASIFGSGASFTTSASFFGNASSLFTNTTAATSTVANTTTSSSLFGSVTTTPSIFGAPVAVTSTMSSSTPSSTSSSSIFGSSGQSNLSKSGPLVFGGSSFFGNSTTSVTSTTFGTSSPSSLVFGGSAAETVTSSSGNIPPSTTSALPATTSSVSTPSVTSVPPSETTSTTSTSSSTLFSPTTLSSTGMPSFGTSPTTLATSVFGTSSSATPSSAFSSVPATVTGTTIFGGATVTTSSPSFFGSPSATTPSATLGTTTSAPPVFGSTTTATSSTPAFGSVTSATSSPSVFGNTGATTSSTPSVFGNTAPTTSSSIFNTSTTTTSVFGSPAPATVSSSLFGTAAISTASSNIFGTATPTTSTTAQVFGMSPTTSATTVFGSPSVTSTSTIFGNVAPASTTSSSLLFGTAVTSATSAPIFGTSTATTTSATALFGATPTTTTSSTSIFGTAATTSSASVFGSTPTTTASIFGGATAATTATNANVFGATQALSSTSFFGSPSTSASTFGAQTSPFSAQPKTFSPFFQSASPTSNAFAATTTTAGSIFGGSTTFGQSGGNLFGNTTTPNKFASSGSVFGGGGLSFGSPTQQNTFASGQSGGNIFGGSPSAFSSGSQQSVSQSGFGAPAAFGASGGSIFGGQATFGSAPTFGGSATFGSPKKVFGDTPGSPAFGSPTQQSSTFENLAGQNTLTFGNLAQNQPTGFGATPPSFGASPQPQQTFPATSTFGGSSFSTWR